MFEYDSFVSVTQKTKPSDAFKKIYLALQDPDYWATHKSNVYNNLSAFRLPNMEIYNGNLEKYLTEIAVSLFPNCCFFDKKEKYLPFSGYYLMLELCKDNWENTRMLFQLSYLMALSNKD